LDTYSKIICLVGGRRTNASEYEGDFTALRLLMQSAAIVNTPVVQIGSASEIGMPPGGGKVLELSDSLPTSDYGEWKLRATKLAISSSSENCVLRLFNVAGFPLKRATAFQMLVGPFLEQDSEVLVRTPGVSFVRDYLDIDTICTAVIEACKLGLQGLYNVCSGHGVVAQEIIEWAEQITGQRARIEISGDIDYSEVVGNNTRITGALGHDLRCNWQTLREQIGSEGAKVRHC
jgi:nucleoside-diphosphate-sugar epimerase